MSTASKPVSQATATQTVAVALAATAAAGDGVAEQADSNENERKNVQAMVKDLDMSIKNTKNEQLRMLHMAQRRELVR